MMVSFYAVLFDPRDVLDEILNLIGSVSEGFPSYSYIYIYIYIYRRKIFPLCPTPCKENIPREEGFLGGIILQKMGFGNLLGEVS